MKKVDVVEVNGEKIYLRKTFLGWGVVYPMKVDGKTNWKNLIAGGSWIKLAILVFVVGVIVSCLFDYANAIRVANECLEKLSLQTVGFDSFFN